MRRCTSPHWRLLDHTADIRMEVEGSSLGELFVNAAEGLSCLISEPRHVVLESELDLALEADTTEDLLVDWLRELLFLHEVRDLVPVHVQMLNLSSTSMEARLSFRKKDPDEIPPFEIKAVTYHDLCIERTDKGYVTRIVFDV